MLFEVDGTREPGTRPMTWRTGSNANPAYCEAALPVPINKTFTYSLPVNLNRIIPVGCRVVVPFRSRTLTGVVLGTHDTKPDYEVRSVRRVLDEDGVLSEELIELGRWISSYYCAPIGEVLKTMLPLGGETRSKTVVSLTPTGSLAAKEFQTTADTHGLDGAVLLHLRRRPLTLRYLVSKHRGGAAAVRRLEKRGLVAVEESIEERDPTLARDGLLLVEANRLDKAPEEPEPAELWLLEYLKSHPGRHDLRALSVERADAVRIARRLATLGAVRLEVTPHPTQARRPVTRPELNAAQRTAVDAIEPAVRRSRFETFLLQGVTGSGKTEVYLAAIEATLKLGRSALLLVPEIALTPALAAQVFERFGECAAILHSAFSDLKRSNQWRRIQSREVRVVLGTRSAVFAPLHALGLVIVDEEHDGSYKQGEAPRYNGRDVAIVRARAAGAVVVLGSATPALESRWNAESGKYKFLRMPSRILERPLPTVHKIDMRQEFAETGCNALFSRELTTRVQDCVSKGEQAMILLNRRGYAVYVLCRACGRRVECGNCSVTLTYHRREQRLVCHYCEHSEPVPTRCADCGSEFLYFQGSGSEKVEAELKSSFPQARIARLDRDTVRGRQHYETILRSFRDGACNLLVGTQMIAKGHDIPNVTLVCVVDADLGLGRPDFRAAERTFQLLTQVAGRAGRGERLGHVLLQTRNPDHYAIELAAQQDYESFYRREMHFRKSFWYPPLTAMATMVVRSRVPSHALAMSRQLGTHLQPPPAGLRLIGPAAAPLPKLRAEYRYQFLIKARQRKAIADLLGKARLYAEEQGWSATTLVIDVDPVDLA